MNGRRVFVLLTHEPTTGCATRPVAVVGVDGDEASTSWVPYEEADHWRARAAETSAPMAAALEAWTELTDGISWEIVELEAPASVDLRGSVEAVMDELLARLV